MGLVGCDPTVTTYVMPAATEDENLNGPLDFIVRLSPPLLRRTKPDPPMSPETVPPRVLLAAPELPPQAASARSMRDAITARTLRRVAEFMLASSLRVVSNGAGLAGLRGSHPGPMSFAGSSQPRAAAREV